MVKRDTNPHLPQVQDKDELTMKKLKTEGGDKDGIKDAEVCALLMGPFFLPSRLIFIPPGVSIISKNGFFYKSSYLRFEFFITMQN